MQCEHCAVTEHCVEAVTALCKQCVEAVVAAQTRMASDLREELNCSVCLNIFSDPVMLSCGHNFCRVCIGNVLDTQDGAGVYTCPECRAEFTERPALQRNMKLCNIAEQFSLQSGQTAAAILCVYCVQAPVPAVKTCVQCETSLCDLHLAAHNQIVEHALTEPTVFMGNKKCPVHNEAFKYYCTQNAVCVCVSCCLAGEHKKQDVELLAVASEKKKEELRRIIEKLNSRKRKKMHQELSLLQEELKPKAAGITKRVTTLLGDIRDQVDALEKRVLGEISRQREDISHQISDLMKQQEMEKEELAGKIRRMEELCKMTDPITVLQGWETHRVDDDTETEGKDPEIQTVNEDLILVNLYSGLTDIMMDLKKSSCVLDLTLDIKTVNERVALSHDLKTANLSEIMLSYPETAERFVMYEQVFSIESISTGQHYFEVEFSESGCCEVGVTYPSIERDGEESRLGDNKKSWCLVRSHDGIDLSYIHNCEENEILNDSPVQRVGVYVDYDAGRLSFYQLGVQIRHLHTFTTTFTEPLHAMFSIYKEAWIRIRL
uniref:Tripartite motif-containing protein 16-like n=1 Tax=Leptobrachium leishanense TaxID=445787 RepID=A0A8C5M1C1_9ANUR